MGRYVLTFVAGMVFSVALTVLATDYSFLGFKEASEEASCEQLTGLVPVCMREQEPATAKENLEPESLAVEFHSEN